MKNSYIIFTAIIFSCATLYPMNQNTTKKTWLDKLKEETNKWEKRRTHHNTNAVGIPDTFELEKIKKFTDKK